MDTLVLLSITLLSVDGF